MYSNPTLTKGRVLGYASGILSESILYNMYFTYYLIFLTDVAGLRADLAGTVSLISVLWDAVTDPMVGYMADKRHADKRKYMARAAFPMGIAFICMLSAPEFSTAGKFIFYIAITMLFWLAYTFYTIPYYSVVAQMTCDYDERTKIRSQSSIINTVAICAGNGAPPLLVALFAGMGFSAAMGWCLMATVLAVFAVLFALVAAFSLKKVAFVQPLEKEEWDKAGILKTFASIAKLKPFKWFLLFVFFYLVASSMIQANILYVILNCVGQTEDFMVYIVLILVLSMLVFIPVTTVIAEKRDRRMACIVLFSLMLVLLITVKLIGITAIWVLIVEAVAMATGTAAFWTVFYSMAYDMVEVDEYVNGTRREGAITALPQLVQKLGSAFGVFLAGIFLSAAQYDSALPVQSKHTIQGIENIATVYPALFLAVSLVGLYFYPITKKRFTLLKQALECRRKNQEFTDMQALRRVI